MHITTVQKARVQLLMHHPFFASIVMSTPQVERTDIWLAATDAKSIFINTPACEQLTVDEMKFIWAHEALHIMLYHVPMMLENKYDRTKWNQATDYFINLTLTKCGFTMVKGGLWDAKYDGMSSPVIYDTLPDPPKKGGKGGGTGEPGEPGEGAGEPWEDLVEPEGAFDDAAMADLKRSVQQRVAQAASIARLCGKMPAELERLVSEILDPVVPWPEVLREYMTRTTQDDESWARRNRRYNAVCLPRRYSEHLGEIIFIGDTSGSISNDELARGAAEVRSVAELMRPERIRLVWADAAVAGEQIFELHDPIEIAPTGGGGTDMRVPLEYVEQFNPPVVVLMTDGYTPWPAVAPPYPLIVLCTTDADCPVGQVIRVR